jgi:putative ABC transport system substrate-binding protein
MRRREFIRLIGGAAVVWPLAASAQQAEQIRRIAILMNVDSDEQRENQALQQLGWTDGRTVRIDTRWANGQASEIRKHAVEIVALAPDLIVATGNAGMVPLLQATRTIPIVFANVADPVGAGIVETMARPGGNATGFVQFEYSLSGKWLELLKQIAPSVTRVAVLRDPDIPSGIGQFAIIQSVAPPLGVEVSSINIRDVDEIERAVTAFARPPNGGLVITPSALAVAHRELIVSLAAKYRLPAVYYRRWFVDKGGLISYGYDALQQYRNAAGYVDRVFKGAKPADLPVQVPTKYDLVINLKTAKALGLAMPPSLLTSADEVIE